MIEVTEASDASHALNQNRRHDRESLNEFAGITWQKADVSGKGYRLEIV
jgi:hypothetical protein